MPVEPYLSFGGRCDEAMEFYKAAVGAEVTMVMRFNQCPQPMPPGSLPPGFDDKVMHAGMRIAGSNVLFTDGPCHGEGKFEGISLSLTAKDDPQAERYFAALAGGGQIRMPMAPTFFASRFGMVTDKFGVSWMVLVTPSQTPDCPTMNGRPSAKLEPATVG